MAQNRAPLRWCAFYPDLVVPEGLTFEDLKHAARHLHEYEAEDGDDASAVEVVARIYQELAAVVEKSAKG